MTQTPHPILDADRRARLTFTKLRGNQDIYLWCDLDGFHRGQRVEQRCEHGCLVVRCAACGTPTEIVTPAECMHTLVALADVPPGLAVMLTGPQGWTNPVRVEWTSDEVAPFNLDLVGGRQCSASS